MKFVGGREIVLQSGTIIYDESLNSGEKDFLDKIFTDEQFNYGNVTISAKTETTNNHINNELLYDIFVPVTDFYDSISEITSEKLLSIQAEEDAKENGASSQANTDSKSDTSDQDRISLIPVRALNYTQKLLAVDGAYYLDNFRSGAQFRKLVFSDNIEIKTQESIEKVKIIDYVSGKLQSKIFPSAESVLSINQTGVTALARKMQTKLQQVGDGAYFAEHIKDFLSATDLTHISNEVSFADDCNVGASSVVLCSDPRMLATIEAIGTDIVELTGNHNNDWSTQDNLDTISLYESKGYKVFGGGKNEESARVPLQIAEKGNKITWIGINLSTSTKTNGQGASGDKPGANIYDETVVKNQIAEAKSKGDFVIIDVQYFECYSYPDYGQEMPSCDAPIAGQQEFFRSLVEFGADLIVGTQAHHPQTYELYQQKPIYYGLGNLFFDQTYWPGTTRSIILTHYFFNGKLLQTKMSPTVYDNNFQTRLMDTDAAARFIERLNNSSPRGN